MRRLLMTAVSASLHFSAAAASIPVMAEPPHALVLTADHAIARQSHLLAFSTSPSGPGFVSISGISRVP
jgi:hypothetical protein